MIVIVHGEEFECDRAVRGKDYIHLYEGNSKIVTFSGISDFNGYNIEGGEWEIPEPTLEQRNRADIDYIGMMTGVL